MPKLLVTGGSGYLGSEVIRKATQGMPWQVFATYHSHRPDNLDAELYQLDIQNINDVYRVVEDIHPTIIIHTAYRQKGPDVWSISAQGAERVAQVARKIGARFIHMSTDALFDGESTVAYTEVDGPNPITPYGEAKAAAERLVKCAYPESVIVRTSLIYGGKSPSPHEQLVLDALDGQTSPTFFADEIRCPIHVSDLAEALLELATMDLSGILHMAGRDAVSRYEFACLFAKSQGRSSDTLCSGLSAKSGMKRPRNCVLDCTKAQELLRTNLRGVYDILGRPEI
ncbi:MAG: SDR family oxidoreductase [Chloroflexota bacterium]